MRGVIGVDQALSFVFGLGLLDRLLNHRVQECVAPVDDLADLLVVVAKTLDLRLHTGNLEHELLADWTCLGTSAVRLDDNASLDLTDVVDVTEVLLVYF